jgi:hypothetical protein
MSKKSFNIDFIYDSECYWSRHLLACLDEIQFTIPEYHVLNYMCDVGAYGQRKDVLRYISHRKPTLFRKPSEEEMAEALDTLLSKGHLVEINEFHLETIKRLLDMCKIIYRGFLPNKGDIDVTPKGFSVYRYWREIVFSAGYIEKNDVAAIFDNGMKTRFGDTKIICYCGASKELLVNAMQNYQDTQSSTWLHYDFNIDQIRYCGQWCRRWYKIIPIGYLCETRELNDEENDKRFQERIASL